MSEGLTGRQRVFVEAYLDCLNATEAARRAGYAEPNKQGPRLLVNVGIRAALDAGLRERTLPKDEVLARLTAHARGDMADFLRVDEEEVTLTWSLLAIPTDKDGNADIAGTVMRLAEQENVKPTDKILMTETVKRSTARLDMLAAGEAGKLHLVKKYSLDDKGKVAIELYDAQAALLKIGEAYGIFRDRGADALEALAAAALAAQQALDRKLVPADDGGGAAGVPGEPEPDGGAGPHP